MEIPLTSIPNQYARTSPQLTPRTKTNQNHLANFQPLPIKSTAGIFKSQAAVRIAAIANTSTESALAIVGVCILIGIVAYFSHRARRIRKQNKRVAGDEERSNNLDLRGEVGESRSLQEPVSGSSKADERTTTHGADDGVVGTSKGIEEDDGRAHEHH